MAVAVADIFESGGTLLAEAGTGTGKTLAYLIPALSEWAPCLGVDWYKESPRAALL